MAGKLTPRPLGPFGRGVIDRANASIGAVTGGAMRRARGVVYSGATKLSTRGGSRVALTFYDDQGSPALVTSVLGVWTFTDRALALAHSTATNKVYLYILASTMDSWYNAAGVLQANGNPQPIASLWSGVTVAPDVMMTEGLGTAYFAHTAAADASSLAFPMRQYNPSAATIAVASITRVGAVATATTTPDHYLRTGDLVTIAGANEVDYNVTRAAATVTGAKTFTYAVANAPATPATGVLTALPLIINVVSDLDGDGTAEPLYARGCVAFQQHLWIWGVGSGTTAANHFRPELARYCQPNFTLPFLAADSITVGNRVRSLREQIVGGAVAGDALFLGTPFTVTRVRGFGRTSWFKKPLDSSFGFPGPKCMAARGATLYYASSRGPVRCADDGAPDPLWPAIENGVAAIINPQKTAVCYDEQSDVVLFLYDGGAGVRTYAPFDAMRNVWLGPDDDIGLVIRAGGSVAPVFASTAATTTGPAGPPTAAVTSAIGATTALASWTTGDVTAQTSVEYRRQGDTAWIVASVVPAGVTSYQFSGLSVSVAYEWRAAHLLGGTSSSYLGPSVATQFTTTANVLNAPSSLALSVRNDSGVSTILVSWVNAGEDGASTDVDLDAGLGDGFQLKLSVLEPQASVPLEVTVSGTYRVRIRHVKPNYTSSAYTAPVTIIVTIGGDLT